MTSIAAEEGTLVRVIDPDDGQPTWAHRRDDGLVEVPGTIERLHRRHRAGEQLATGRRLESDTDLAFLPAVSPTKIVCVGLNYRQHADEMGRSLPEVPLLFMKPPSALVGPGDAIELPPQSDEVHHEGELAVVIGRRLRRADRTEAADAIFGYSCACDVTARDIQRREDRYTRSKGFDTFAPIGPSVALAPEFVPADHRLTCRVDGEIRQTTVLDDFIFPVDEVLSFISGVMTLEPGDVVLTGTPSGVGPIDDGQVVTVEIDGIGILKNPVIHRD